MDKEKKPIIIETADIYLHFPYIMEEEADDLADFSEEEHIESEGATDIFIDLQNQVKRQKEAIDKAIERKKNVGSTTETNIESMIVLVSKGRKIDEDYTFYQLQADYEMELRLEQSRAIPVYRAVGADIEPIVLAEVLSMHEGPYSFDKMFKKNDRQQDNLSK